MAQQYEVRIHDSNWQNEGTGRNSLITTEGQFDDLQEAIARLEAPEVRRNASFQGSYYSCVWDLLIDEQVDSDGAPLLDCHEH